MRGMGLHMGLSRSVTRPSLSHYSASNPLYIAHRGSGFMYPEYSVQSYAAAFGAGLRVLEGDCRPLTDGEAGLMHDATVDRTTTSAGDFDLLDTASYKALVMDSDGSAGWHGSNYGPHTQMLLSELIGSYSGRAILVLEAKDASSDFIVAELEAASVATDQALINSFVLSDLVPAQTAGYPVSFNSLITDDQAAARVACQAAGVTSVGLNTSFSDAVITDWISAGFDVILSNTFRRWQRDYYRGLGVHQFYADDAQYLQADAPLATRDNFAAQSWMPGMLAYTDGYALETRGRFVAPDKWGWEADTGHRWVLQGWACPVKGDSAASDFSVDFSVTFMSALSADRWAGMFIADEEAKDRPFSNTVDAANRPYENGYVVLARKNGTVQVYRLDAGVATSIAVTAGASISDGAEASYRATVTPTTVTMERLDVPTSATAPDTTYRGGYFHLGHSGAAVLFRDITIS